MQVKIDRRFASAATLLVLSSATAPCVHAQQAKLETLEEVIVTAQRREQKILDVPMSITALTGESLTRQGAASLLDLASVVPGMSTVEFSPGQNRVQLRGISSMNGKPTVGTYLDEMPLNVEGGFPSYGADIRFIDLERVEVLRGPQGTLYGEGSMGGTIKYVTRAPNLDQASIGFDTTFGSVTDGSNLYRGNVVVNLPVVEGVFAVRLAGGYEQSPGWIDYTATGNKDANEGTSETGRLKALWKVSESFTASLMLMAQNTDQEANNLGNIRTRTSPFAIESPYIDKNRLASLVLNYDADAFSVMSATSYMRRTSDQSLDFTSLLPPVLLAIGFDPAVVAGIDSISAQQYFEFKGLTQELRFASRGEGPFTWTGGLYFRDYDQEGWNRTVTLPSIGFELLTGVPQSSNSQAQAVFGEVNYAFTNRFDVTLGLRYEREKRESAEAQKAEFSSVNPRLVLSYRPADGVLVYASAAKGFRSGGMNGLQQPPGCNFPPAYDPEKLWTYEIGSNLSMAGGRVVVQTAVFHNDWDEIQVLQYCQASIGTLVGNGGKATGTGLDLQVTLRPLDGLTLALSGSYNDSEYKDTSATHWAGDPIDFVPEFTASVSGDYDFNWTASLPGRIHLDYQYTDQFSIALRNLLVTQGGAANSDAYGKLNARVSVMRGDWEFALFGTNLTDVNKQSVPLYAGYLLPTTMMPRTVGIGIRYNY